LFEPGVDVATYSSTRDCIEKIAYFLAHPAERERIAAAGQQRTLRDHTFLRRVSRICEVIDEERNAR
jgi:spore maturation protein CgeB